MPPESDAAAVAYRETRPAPELADLVECFWTSRSAVPARAERTHRVLPDGCSDIIFNFGDPMRAVTGPSHAFTSYVVGAMRRPLAVRQRGAVELLGVRFRPGGATPFLPVAASELTDRVVALAELWRGEAGDAESLLFDLPPGARVARLQALLLRRLAAGPAPDRRVAHVARLIERSGGRATVRALHDAVGMGRRQLERLYADAVGLTPKMACRVARLRETLRRLDDEPGVSWSRLAYSCGYADQPHLVREFRALTGVTPGAYRDRRGRVASVQDDGLAAD
ncbi:MAG TPA: helix-turn-helix domain-containing protein [Longimicrobiales bacterium]|nr:helix-turn-helix domain-containing protein [Longimicrobiales bacterium]